MGVVWDQVKLIDVCYAVIYGPSLLCVHPSILFIGETKTTLGFDEDSLALSTIARPVIKFLVICF